MERIADGYKTPTTLKTFSNKNGNFVLKGNVEPVRNKDSMVKNCYVRKLYKQENVDGLKTWNLVRAKISNIGIITQLKSKKQKSYTEKIEREKYNKLGETIESSKIQKAFNFFRGKLDPTVIDYSGKELEVKQMKVNMPKDIMIKDANSKWSPMAKRIMKIISKNIK